MGKKKGVRHDPNCKGARGYGSHQEQGIDGGVTSNSPPPTAHRRPGVDTRQPWMEGATPTHFILKITVWKRKGKRECSGGFYVEARRRRNRCKMGTRCARGKRRRKGGGSSWPVERAAGGGGRQ
jgi:hypothetical protein